MYRRLRGIDRTESSAAARRQSFTRSKEKASFFILALTFTVKSSLLSIIRSRMYHTVSIASLGTQVSSAMISTFLSKPLSGEVMVKIISSIPTPKT